LQDPPKFTQIGIFGLKIYHLAALVERAKREKDECSFVLTTFASVRIKVEAKKIRPPKVTAMKKTSTEHGVEQWKECWCVIWEARVQTLPRPNFFKKIPSYVSATTAAWRKVEFA
jgi:hypothetical protein